MVTEQGLVLVKAVIPRSAAASAGLKPGDVLLQVAGRHVVGPSTVAAAVSGAHVGERVALVVRRSGEERLLSAQLGEHPGSEGVLRNRYIGRRAPALEQIATARGVFPPSLGALEGRVVVMEFWASWCVACRVLLPTMNEWYGRYEAQGATFVGITVDPVGRAARHAAELGMNYPVVSDETGSTTRSYSAMALPMVFVIDRRGIVRDILVGYDPDRIPEVERLVERLVREG